MYTSFLAEGFRGFRRLEVGGLRRVNLVAGANCVGKTALLEAIFLHCGAFNPALVVTVDRSRGIGSYKIEAGAAIEPPWRSLFAQFDESRPFRLEGAGCPRATRDMRFSVRGGSDGGGVSANGRRISELDQGGAGTSGAAIPSQERQQELLLDYTGEMGTGQTRLYFHGGQFKTDPAVPATPAFQARFLPDHWRPNFKADAELFGKLDVVNEQQELIGILGVIEPRLKRLSTIVLGGEPMLHADIGLRRLVPLAFLGGGLLRVTKLVLELLHAKDGVLLVDEIENGIHHRALKQVWQTLGHAAKRVNTQLFATTHSRDCVTAAHEAFSDIPDYDFSLQRLERNRDGDIQAVGYDKEALDGAILSGFEVR